MTTTGNFQGRIKLLLTAAGENHRALARWLGVSDPTVSSWIAGTPANPASLRRACAASGLTIEWLRDGEGDTAREVAKYRPVSVADAELGRVCEDDPDFHEAVSIVMKHGSSADRAALQSKAVELARKLGRARSILRGSGAAPHTPRSGGGHK